MARTTLLIGFLALWTVGCGDDDDDDSGGLSCTSSACGGDIAGIWTIDETCPDVVPPENEQCPSAVITLTDGPNLAGTATFEAGGTYSLDIQVTGEADIVIPPECTLNGTVPCATLQGVLEAEFPGSTCADGAVENSCECNLIIDTDADEQGTYTVEGTTLHTVAEDDGDPDTDESNDSEYCAQGTSLLVKLDNYEIGMISVLAHK